MIGLRAELASHRLKVLWFVYVHGTPDIHSMHGTSQELAASVQTTQGIKLAIQGHVFGNF